MKKDIKRIEFKVPTKLADLIKNTSKEMDMSSSEYIRLCINTHLERRTKEIKRAKALAKAKLQKEGIFGLKDMKADAFLNGFGVKHG